MALKIDRVTLILDSGNVEKWSHRGKAVLGISNKYPRLALVVQAHQRPSTRDDMKSSYSLRWTSKFKPWLCLLQFLALQASSIDRDKKLEGFLLQSHRGRLPFCDVEAMILMCSERDIHSWGRQGLTMLIK